MFYTPYFWSRLLVILLLFYLVKLFSSNINSYLDTLVVRCFLFGSLWKYPQISHLALQKWRFPKMAFGILNGYVNLPQLEFSCIMKDKCDWTSVFLHYKIKVQKYASTKSALQVRAPSSLWISTPEADIWMLDVLVARMFLSNYQSCEWFSLAGIALIQQLINWVKISIHGKLSKSEIWNIDGIFKIKLHSPIIVSCKNWDKYMISIRLRAVCYIVLHPWLRNLLMLHLSYH